MHLESGDILHMEIGDSAEVERKSSLLERLTVERGMAYLRGKGVAVSEVVTDASRTLISLFSKYCK
jgi:hypothetical protein